MAKVARLTDGETNWVFFAEETVKITTFYKSQIVKVEELSLEEGRKIYSFIVKFSPKAKKGFTPLQRKLKSFRLTTVEQVQAYEDHRRETIGEEAWADEDPCTWPEFHELGYMEVYYTAGSRAKDLSWLP